MFKLTQIIKSHFRVGNILIIFPEKNILRYYSKPHVVEIPLNKLLITYSRSSGAGGQNVNMVNTKVDLRFHVETADWIDPKIRLNLVKIYGSKITKDGFLVIKSEKTRSQQMNLTDAIEKLRLLIHSAVTPEPKIIPQEVIQSRINRANQKRILLKRQRSQTKTDRQVPDVFNKY